MAHLRISTASQDLANQKLAILDHAHQKHFAVDRFVEVQASSRKGRDPMGIDVFLNSLTAGDRLVVSELSRLGRSLGQVIQIVEQLVQRRIRFTAIKENIRFEGKQDLQTKVMIALFGLFAEVERDLISVTRSVRNTRCRWSLNNPGNRYRTISGSARRPCDLSTRKRLSSSSTTTPASRAFQPSRTRIRSTDGLRSDGSSTATGSRRTREAASSTIPTPGSTIRELIAPFRRIVHLSVETVRIVTSLPEVVPGTAVQNQS